MAIGDFFKSASGGEPEFAAFSDTAERYAEFARLTAEGQLSFSQKRVAVITLSESLRAWLAKRLEQFVGIADYDYNDNPSVDYATNAQIVIMDVTPLVDARLHDKYDKLVRIKKSMGKKYDVLSVIGERESYPNYPRGTYPSLLYFCIKEDDLEHRDPDLPPQGAATIEGPTLYNFVDLPDVILEKIRQLQEM